MRTIARILCSLRLHKWVKTKYPLARNREFSTRKCTRCQREEVGAFGPMGDGQWHEIGDVEMPPWEREEFDAARGRSAAAYPR